MFSGILFLPQFLLPSLDAYSAFLLFLSRLECCAVVDLLKDHRHHPSRSVSSLQPLFLLLQSQASHERFAQPRRSYPPPIAGQSLALPPHSQSARSQDCLDFQRLPSRRRTPPPLCQGSFLSIIALSGTNVSILALCDPRASGKQLGRVFPGPLGSPRSCAVLAAVLCVGGCGVRRARSIGRVPFKHVEHQGASRAPPPALTYNNHPPPGRRPHHPVLSPTSHRLLQSVLPNSSPCINFRLLLPVR